MGIIESGNKYVLSIVDEDKGIIKISNEIKDQKKDISISKLELFNGIRNILNFSEKIIIAYLNRFDNLETNHQLIIIDQFEYDEFFIIELYIYLAKYATDVDFRLTKNLEDRMYKERYEKYLARTFRILDPYFLYRQSDSYHAINYMSLTLVSNIDKEGKSQEAFSAFNMKYDQYSSDFLKVLKNQDQKIVIDILNLLPNIVHIVEKISFFRRGAERQKSFDRMISYSKEELQRVGATSNDFALISLIKNAVKNLYIWDLFIYFEVLKDFLTNKKISDASDTFFRVQYSNSLLLSSSLLQLIENCFQYAEITEHFDEKEIKSKKIYYIYRHLNFRFEGNKATVENQYKCLKDKGLLLDLLDLNDMNEIYFGDSGMLFYLQDLSEKGIKQTSFHSIKDFIFYEHENFENANRISHYGINFFTNTILKLGGVVKVESDDEAILLYMKKNKINCVEKKAQFWNEEKHLIGTRYIVYVPFPLVNRKNLK